MKALCWHGQGDVRIDTVHDPKIMHPRDAVIKVTATAITVTALMPDATDSEFFERAEMLDTKVGVGEKDDPGFVAKQGFDALTAGKNHVFGGSLMKQIKKSMNDLISEQTKAKMYAGAAKPASAAGAKQNGEAA